MPLSSLEADLFPAVTDKPLVLHCAIGKRSAAAARMLLKAGHAKVLHMEGGLTAWKSAGLPIEEAVEEVVEADIIVHVRDISHPDTEAQAADVQSVLAQLGIHGDSREASGRAIVTAWNKIDCLGAAEKAETTGRARREGNIAAISAVTGEGIEDLREFDATEFVDALFGEDA